MLLTNLFQNLREHAIASNNLDFAEELTPFDLVRSLRHLEFDEAGQQLRSLLEKGYQDGIDGLENVRVEGGKIKGIFIDKVTSTLTKRYEFTVDENAVRYKLINPAAVEQADFTELEFARTKLAGDTKKVKSCPKGTPCRYSCIAKGKECSYTPSADEKGEITFLKQKIGNKKTSEIPDAEKERVAIAADTKKGSISPVPDVTIKNGASFYQIDVSNLSGGKTDKNVDALAKQIASDKGYLATPIIAIRKGIDEYVVAKDPDNEILAAAARKAKEIDPRAGELISTYTVKNQEEADAVLYQRKLAGKLDTPSVKGAEFKTIDVKNISGGKKTQLDDETIEKIAQSQLKVGNALPLVLRETGGDSYEVVSGDAAIIAGRKAREIDPRRGEMINAFVIPYKKP
jgi:hypothetical protein